MMRSLYSGVSGLQNHQTRMDVIGNNISNVNTTGFKRGRVNFQDMISQQLSGAAKPTDEIGGVNAKEVGLGMTVASIDNIFNQGNLQSTGVSTDIAIQGNGFFVLKSGEESFYTRNGAFGLDMNGTLVNPATGMRGIYGEYLINAQGEDVVAGIRTPQPITKLEEDLPECYKQFIEIANKLEKHYRDMQDMEFTIEEGKLFFLQTRSGKRTAAAALQIACDLVDEGMITSEEAVCRIEAKSLDQLLHPNFDANALKKGEVIGQGLPASPGAAAGRVYFNAEDAVRTRRKGYSGSSGNLSGGY